MDLDYDSIVTGPAHAQKPGWDSSFASHVAVKEAQNMMPHPGVSQLGRDAAMEEPFRDKLQKTRAVAAGTHLSEGALCHERQRLDREDMELTSCGLVRTQGPLKAELSPRRAFQRDEIKHDMKERRSRERAAAERVERSIVEEAVSRIPMARPLVLGSSYGASWDSSVVLDGESKR